MTEQMWVSLAIQIPLVVAFMWFVLEINKRSDLSNQNRDVLAAAANQKRDEEWRAFLTSQREQYITALGRFAEELKFHGGMISILNAALLAKDPDMAKTIVELQRQQMESRNK